MTMTLVGPADTPPSLPVQLLGMDKHDALKWVSQMFDAANAGDVVWDDNEIVDRFLAQCSRTGSEETKAGYRRDLTAFRQWLWLQDPERMLRAVTPQQAEDWVSYERSLVGTEDGQRKPRSFNRRVAAVSALFRWASEPNRSTSTGIARNPLPRRQMIDVAKAPKPLTHADLALIIKAIEDAGNQRDLVLVKGAYLIGCRVSELAALKWGDIETLDDGGQVNLLGKGSKRRTVRISSATLALFNSIRPQTIGEDDWVFPSTRRGSGHLTRQAIGSRVRHWGKVALGTDARVWPHRLRSTHATHAIRANVDVFTLQSTLGHSSTSTTQGYVAANPADSSSLRLG